MGKRVGDDIREKIIAMRAAGVSLSQIAKEFELGKSTVHGILKKYNEEKPDQFEQMRTEKKTEYIEEASKVVKGLLSVLSRRVDTILKDEDVIDEIIDIIADSDLTDKAKSSLIGKMTGIMSPKLTELTTAFGTVYDKLEKIKLDEGATDEGCGVVEVTKTIEISPPTEGESDE